MDKDNREGTFVVYNKKELSRYAEFYVDRASMKEFVDAQFLQIPTQSEVTLSVGENVLLREYDVVHAIRVLSGRANFGKVRGIAEVGTFVVIGVSLVKKEAAKRLLQDYYETNALIRAKQCDSRCVMCGEVATTATWYESDGCHTVCELHAESITNPNYVDGLWIRGLDKPPDVHARSQRVIIEEPSEEDEKLRKDQNEKVAELLSLPDSANGPVESPVKLSIEVSSADPSSLRGAAQIADRANAANKERYERSQRIRDLLEGVLVE